jgi:glucosamine-6-phosphate deaminase
MTTGVRVFKNANDLYYAVLEHLMFQVIERSKTNPTPTFALPTGNTMIPLYRLIAEREAELFIQQWKCFNLDEYYPITDETDALSFQSYLDQFFYGRLKGGVKKRRSLNGRTSDPIAECLKYESWIQNEGGIDLCILGLGRNGHIGFNEPGSEPLSRTHLVQLHPDTLMANFPNQMAEGKIPPFQQAMTMGIDSILESRHIIVIALGKAKAAAVRAAIEETPTRTCPASFLQDHFSVTWFLDHEAASLLTR